MSKAEEVEVVRLRAAESALARYAADRVVTASDGTPGLMDWFYEIMMEVHDPVRMVIRFLDRFEGKILEEYGEWRDSRIAEIDEVKVANEKRHSEKAPEKELQTVPAPPTPARFVQSYLKRRGKTNAEIVIRDLEWFRFTADAFDERVQATRIEIHTLNDGTEIKRSQTYHLYRVKGGWRDSAGVIHVR